MFLIEESDFFYNAEEMSLFHVCAVLQQQSI